MYQDVPTRRDLDLAPVGVDCPPERTAGPPLDGHHEVMGLLRQIVSDVLRVPGASVTADSALPALPSVESIKWLRIAGKVERRFDIELDNEALFRRGTLGD